MKNENESARWVIDDGLLGQQDHIDRLTEDLDNPERHWCAVGTGDGEGYAETVAYCHPDNAPLIAAAPAMFAALQALLPRATAAKRFSRADMLMIEAVIRQAETGEPPPEWPECYLYVEESRSGQTWVVPIEGNMTLDLERRVKAWIKSEFGGELRLDGGIMSRLQGDYYAAIYIDHRPPTSAVCWQSGGFYLK